MMPRLRNTLGAAPWDPLHPWRAPESNLSPDISRLRAVALVLFVLLSAATHAFAATVFSTPVPITDGAAQYQLSRTANHVAAFDSEGRLHLTYWSGGLATLPDTPSYVYYRDWTASEGWSAQQQIDNSEVAGAGHLGGRHPSLAVAADGSVWVVWSDHRNCSPNFWIDNTEIYADVRPPGGSFSSTDIRLTTTASGNGGDNGYAPKIVAHPGSVRLSLAWHDFFYNGAVSDIFLKSTGASGAFNLGEAMSAMRMTVESARGSTPKYTVVDVAVDAAGACHMVWAGGESTGRDLYYAAAAPGASSVAETVLDAGGASFYDPPHIEVAPNGDVWIAYADNSTGGNENITLLRRRAEQPGFDAPIVIAANAARQYMPDHAIDAQGRVHLAWIDERAGTHVYYGIYDPVSSQLFEEFPITTQSRPWGRPAIILDAGGGPFAVWDQYVSPVSGDIWFACSPGPAPDRSNVWVDFSHVGTETGTASEPFNSLAEALAVVDEGGAIQIEAGSTSETVAINQPVRLEAPNGVVRIGAALSGLLPSAKDGYQTLTRVRDWRELE